MAVVIVVSFSELLDNIVADDDNGGDGSDSSWVNERRWFQLIKFA